MKHDYIIVDDYGPPDPEEEAQWRERLAKWFEECLPEGRVPEDRAVSIFSTRVKPNKDKPWLR